MSPSQPSILNVAVIGAGFCGLAAAWHLLYHEPRFPHLNVYLFDRRGIGHSTSGMASGLLHPYAGARSKLNWRGLEGMEATQNLLEAVSPFAPRPLVSERRGILRLALQEEQCRDFQRCAERHPHEVEWLDESACQALAPGCAEASGLWIEQGMAIDAGAYLQALWEACKRQGAQFEQRAIASLNETKAFDLTVVAMGADSTALPEGSHLPLKKVKGQILEFAWPGGCPPLHCALNSHVYLIMNGTGRSCFAGATYEKEYSSAEADPNRAASLLLPKIYALFPPLKQAALLDCHAGIRAAAPQHRPLLERLSPSVWILAGMGSKGLLYHALLAKEFASHVWKETQLGSHGLTTL